jgi:hypothetical protein
MSFAVVRYIAQPGGTVTQSNFVLHDSSLGAAFLLRRGREDQGSGFSGHLDQKTHHQAGDSDAQRYVRILTASCSGIITGTCDGVSNQSVDMIELDANAGRRYSVFGNSIRRYLR